MSPARSKLFLGKKKINKNFFFGSEPGQVTFEKIKYNEQYIDKVTESCDIIFNLIGIFAKVKLQVLILHITIYQL